MLKNCKTIPAKGRPGLPVQWLTFSAGFVLRVEIPGIPNCSHTHHIGSPAHYTVGLWDESNFEKKSCWGGLKF